MKRTISLILLAALLTSCGGASGGETTSAPTTEAAAPAETERRLEVKDFGGYNIRVLSRDDASGSGAWKTLDLVAEEENGDTINDAVYRRNIKIMEDYNVSLERFEMEHGNHVAHLTQLVLAGDDAYDLVLSPIYHQADLAASGYLVNLNTVDSLDIDYDCWDSLCNSFTAIGGKCYYLMGDINITDNDATYNMLFNKEMYAEYKDFPNPYELVKSGDWTLAKVIELAKTATHDVNGNSTMEWDVDRWGILDQWEYGIALLIGSGNPTVKIGSDGMLEYNLNTQKTVDYFEKIHEHFADRSYHLIADHSDYKNVSDLWNTLSRGSFKAGRVLFMGSNVCNVRLLRDMEIDFGILPVPKVDESQEKYYGMLQSGNATAYSMPTTVKDVERSGLILQALCEESTTTLLPAYYEDTLVRKSSRDNESEEMLEIIFENRIIDIACTYNDIGISSFLQDLLKKDSNTFVSSEASKRDGFIAKIESINAAFE